MSSLLTRATLRFLSSHSINQITRTTSALAVVVLIVLLVERQVITASGDEQARPGLRAFDIVIVPFLILFIVVVAARFVKLV